MFIHDLRISCAFKLLTPEWSTTDSLFLYSPRYLPTILSKKLPGRHFQRVVETFYQSHIYLVLRSGHPRTRFKSSNLRRRISKMSNGSLTPLRTTLVLAFMVIFLLWSLLALEMPTSSIIISDVEGIQKPMPQNDQETTSPIADGNDEIDNQDRPLILYVYADGNGSTPLDNLKFFLAHGIHNAADFVFIVNGKTEADVAGMILRENKEGNIRVIKRPNDCYDLGGLASVLLNDDLYKGYKYFITMNASIRGPFLPYWSDACWTDRFLSKVTDKVKLVGITANCWPTFHIQSMIWATDIIGLETLLFPPQSALDFLAQNPVKHIPGPYKDMAEYAEADEEKKKELDLFYAREANETVAINHQPPGINSCFHSWRAAVAGEVSSTALIRAAGYEVDALMNAYHGLESEEYEKGKTCYDNRDLLFDGAYFGINVHPFETVFLKANRGLAPLTLEKHTEWANKRNYSSYDYCKS
ncbi:uncharacterized protein L3040_004524 [Drepanopeziza brunnea f. sp. 'multigermtubi']|uniref:uncharacterized protein n=1 Tax=Drepanopeziza brunnea f. sp. 'multigermtubi' TaxID=698441 RepID=UPI002392D8C4|nr:hypothetical protein L3040_004524 [Drepanopeziza brunnea f. sp. 'multigermtubi']